MFSGRFIINGILALQAILVQGNIVDENTSADRHCKCSPLDRCWPKQSAWEVLNSTVHGRLIKNTPPAIACYKGPQQIDACNRLVIGLTNPAFIANDPVALDYPIDDACPPVNFTAGQVPGTCSIGDTPRYTINATTKADVVASIKFARDRNLRLVIRNTGHDLLGRSTGYGSLQVWLKYVRQGITFQKSYLPSDKCSKSTWHGSAFKIGGGYVWGEVYAEAKKNNVIVVGGGDTNVGCIGGWAQGGGHSPASRDYGLGADQILEAEVVLASGQIVTANACQNQDLYFAIRGGGPGTYGIVLSTTVKAHPTTKVTAQTLSMAPLASAYIPEFMEALKDIYASFPDLNDQGFSGYGSWSVESYAPVFANFTTGYLHAIAIMGERSSNAVAIFAPLAAKLAQYNGTSLFVDWSYLSFDNYAEYYEALSGRESRVGTEAALGSRLLDRTALTGKGLRKMLNTTAGLIGENTFNNICLVSGGQVFKDAEDRNSGLNPGWRTSYIINIVARGWAPGSSDSVKNSVHTDITNIKVEAMRKIAPNTGCYMNEADRLDPTYLQDFYGANLERLERIKAKYDPSDVFFCPTCVGSDGWTVLEEGRLCRVG